MKARFEFQSDETYNYYLRTYFAAMAMQGLAVSWNQHNDHEHAAKLAISLADELLKQLEQ